jgi:hypothetical protein
LRIDAEAPRARDGVDNTVAIEFAEALVSSVQKTHKPH